MNQMLMQRSCIHEKLHIKVAQNGIFGLVKHIFGPVKCIQATLTETSKKTDTSLSNNSRFIKNAF